MGRIKSIAIGRRLFATIFVQMYNAHGVGSRLTIGHSGLIARPFCLAIAIGIAIALNSVLAASLAILTMSVLVAALMALFTLRRLHGLEHAEIMLSVLQIAFRLHLVTR